MSNDPEKRVDWIVSIGDPGRKYPAGFTFCRARKLRLEFHDVHTMEEKRSWESEPKEIDIQQLILFAGQIKNTPKNGLIHCEYGINRSTAAAIIVSSLVTGDDDWSIANVFRVRPQANPNMLMLQIADRLLNKNLAEMTRTIMRQLEIQSHSENQSTAQ
jgi:predicted protein tyrosine phosphatase